jgi:hypothetical protein
MAPGAHHQKVSSDRTGGCHMAFKNQLQKTLNIEQMMELTAREARIFELRAQRVGFRQIGQELGISHTRAHQIYEAARNRIPASRLADLRAEESELLDEGVQSLLKIARDDRLTSDGKPIVSPRTRVEAWNAICKFSESKRRLFGADAPQRKEVTVLSDSVVDAALRKANEDHEAMCRQLEALEKEAKEQIAELGGEVT